MQQNDALVSLNGRLVAWGCAPESDGGVQPPAQKLCGASRVFAMRSPDNREDGRGILTGRSRAKLPSPPLPCGRRGRKRLLCPSLPRLSARTRSLAIRAGARPPKSTIATLAPSSMAQPRASKTSPVTQVLS
ncbi:MAG: hypothetical protein ACLUE1_01410 [Adlercreutzia equolifaciens]